MIDILFVGNSSYDIIVCQGNTYNCIGGSAINSCFGAICYKSPRIAICTHIGVDFLIELLSFYQINIDAVEISNRPSNRFYINEDKKEIKLQTKTYLQVNNRLNYSFISHMHVSIRFGVNAEAFFSNNTAKSISVDVMQSSIANSVNILRKYIQYINFIFCNKDEYLTLVNNFEFDFSGHKNLTLIITDATGVEIIKSNEVVFIKNLPKNTIKVKNTVGAGDTFIGSFLSYYLTSGDLVTSGYLGLAAATLSVTDIGTIHILKKKQKLMEYFELIKQLNG